MRKILLFVMVSILSYGASMAQQAPEYAKPPKSAPVHGAPLPASSPVQQAPYHDWTNVEIYLSAAVLVFALLVIALLALLILKGKIAWTPKAILRVVGLILIICAGLFLITAGYSAEQVAPVMGLLGTIAGYLLGTGEAAGKPARADREEP